MDNSLQLCYHTNMNTIIIYTTYPNLKIAQKISAKLLKNRLVACANFSPIQSVYWWKGKITNSKEIVTVMKTGQKNWAKVKSVIIKFHPYKTPCILKIEVEANENYAAWIKQTSG